MTLRKIATLGHPILRQVAQAVAPEELASLAVQSLIDDLIDTMRDAQGAGLAATQVFVPWRVCVLEVHNNPRYPYKPNIPLTILVNPIITPVGDELFSNFEGCLSVPNLRGRVARHCRVRVQGCERTGKAVDFTVQGLSAGTYQHEVDHLDGVVFVDRVTEPRTFCTWEHFDRYEKTKFAREAEALVARFGA